MKTLLITLVTIAVSLFALPDTAKADYYSYGSSYTYRSGYASCGCATYTRRIFLGYDSCGRPIYRYYRVPVSHHCRSYYRPVHYGYYNHYCRPSHHGYYYRHYRPSHRRHYSYRPSIHRDIHRVIRHIRHH